MTSPTSVLVIGGGAIGLMSAQALASAGCRVVVCERGPRALEASWAGGGILAPLLPWESPERLAPLLRYSQKAYPELAAALLEHTGVDPQWTRSGALMLGWDQDSAGAEWADSIVPHPQWLDAKQLAGVEPAARAECALHLPDVAQVRNPRLLRALHARLKQIGVDLRPGQEVSGFELRDGRVAAARIGGERVQAEVFVIAAGAWSAGLIGQLGLEIPVRPVKGQMLLFKGRPGMLRHIVLGRDAYLVPRRDGRILVGSTVEDAGFDKRPTPDAAAGLRDAALAMVPALGTLPLEAHWAGLRPGSPDELPYIGRHPDIPNLFLSTGHFRLGLTLAPGSAELLSDLVLGRKPRFDPTPFRVEREQVAV